MNIKENWDSDNHTLEEVSSTGRGHEEVKILMNIFYVSSTKMEK